MRAAEPIRVAKAETTCDTMTIACSRTLRERVEAVAKRNGVSRSATLRAMVEHVLPAFEERSARPARKSQASVYNYLIGTADLALTEYIQTGNLAHLRQAIDRLSRELELRERPPAEEEAPTEAAGAPEVEGC